MVGRTVILILLLSLAALILLQERGVLNLPLKESLQRVERAALPHDASNEEDQRRIAKSYVLAKPSSWCNQLFIERFTHARRDVTRKPGPVCTTHIDVWLERIFRRSFCQFELNGSAASLCPTHTVVIENGATGGSGLGSRFNFISRVILKTLAMEAKVVSSLPGGWWADVYAPASSCVDHPTPLCYWQPTSACDAVVERNPQIGNIRMSYFTINKKNFIPQVRANGQLQHSEPYQTRSQDALSAALFYVLQPVQKVADYVAQIRGQLNVPHPYIAMHVRHGDKYTEVPIFPFKDYMAVAAEWRRKDNVTNIFLSTEDQNVIDEAKRYEAEGWRFYFTEYPRLNTDIKKAIIGGRLAGDAEVLNAMANLYIAADGDYWVGTFSSNWGVATLSYQHALYGQVVPYRSLDKQIAFNNSLACKHTR